MKKLFVVLMLSLNGCMPALLLQSAAPKAVSAIVSAAPVVAVVAVGASHFAAQPNAYEPGQGRDLTCAVMHGEARCYDVMPTAAADDYLSDYVPKVRVGTQPVAPEISRSGMVRFTHDQSKTVDVSRH